LDVPLSRWKTAKEILLRTCSWIAAAALWAALALPGTAVARVITVAYTNGPGDTIIWAGPADYYPVVARLDPGTQVNIFGCLPTGDWCRAGVQGIPGWVRTGRLEFAYGGDWVLVSDYFAVFAPPIIEFNSVDTGPHYHRYYGRHRWRDDR